MKSHLILLALVFVGSTAFAQWKEPPATGSPKNNLPDRTTMVGQSGMGPLLLAKLADPDENAKSHKAVIVVDTDGVRIVDPASVHYEPRLDEAHIQYQLDNGPAYASTSKEWTFSHLSHGEHTVTIALISSDNHPMGKKKVLKVSVP